MEVDIPNDDLSIVPGLYATAVLKTDVRKDSLSVPVSAIAREKDKVTVYIINKENKIEEREVRTGIETAERVEIVEGLKADEVVLTGSRALVRPGESVEPKIVDDGAPGGKGVVQMGK